MSVIENLMLACAMGAPRVVVAREDLLRILAVVEAARKLERWSGDMYEFDYGVIYDALAALEGATSESPE